MKATLFFISLLTSQNVFAKEVYLYKCSIDQTLRAELSLLDKKKPNLSLYAQKTKIASCELETSDYRAEDKKSKITATIWRLTLKKCDYYVEKYKTKTKLFPEITLMKTRVEIF